MGSNPKNEERAAEHAKLMDALNKFTEEAREWERLAVAPTPGGGAVASAPLGVGCRLVHRYETRKPPAWPL